MRCAVVIAPPPGATAPCSPDTSSRRRRASPRMECRVSRRTLRDTGWSRADDAAPLRAAARSRCVGNTGERAELKSGIEHPVRRAHERLGEVHRILHDGHQRQVVAVADEVLDERGLVAARHAVAAEPAFLQVRGRHLEHVAFPLAGRETLPAVLRVRRWTRPAVHVDRTARQHPHQRGVPRRSRPARRDRRCSRSACWRDLEARSPPGAAHTAARASSTWPRPTNRRAGVPRR